MQKTSKSSERRELLIKETLSPRSNNKNTKVLFIHGLESGPTSLKANTLHSHYKNFSCPHLTTPKNIWSSMAKIISEVRNFKPDMIVGSSYGSIILMLLLQFGVWDGPSIILACAMSLVAKHRMYLPLNVDTENIVIIHGLKDTICDIEPVRKMAHTYNIEMIELNDTHSLKSLCQEDYKLIKIIDRIMDKVILEPIIEYNRNIHSYYLLRLTFIMLWSLIKYPFSLFCSHLPEKQTLTL